MNESKLQTIYQELCLTSVFIGVLDTPLFQAYANYISAKDGYEKLRAYGAFVACVYKNGGNLSRYVQKAIFEDENAYIKAVAHKQKIPACIEKSVVRELESFSKFASLTVADFASDLGVAQEQLPAFDTTSDNLHALYKKRLRGIDKYGYGIFSASGMFRLSDDKKIEPIVSADKIGMDTFIGYEEERAKVIANTKAFVEGRPALNTLLCGDAGTGKSSTVKAVANAFFD